MDENPVIGFVKAQVNVEVPIRSTWSRDYVYHHIQKFVDELVKQARLMRGSAAKDVYETDLGGAVLRRDCPHMVPGQEDDGYPD